MTEMPDRITQPSDWVRAVEVVARDAITTYKADPSGVGPFRVGKVKYRVGGSVGTDETCLGVLTVDAANWFATGEPWPQARQPSGPSMPCGTATALNIVIRYVACVTGPTDGGGPPPSDIEAHEQLELMDLGWHVYQRFLLAEQPRKPSVGGGELKALGTTRVGTASRLPVEGTGAGFTMPVQCKIGRAC